MANTYAEILDYLYASQPVFHQVGAAAYKPGLTNTYRLMEHLGNPHLSFRSIHVAGTNGKGSTSHLIASVLQSAGYKVGLYTSPHLVDFRERIRINGAMIEEEDVVLFVEANKAFLEEIKPSFFETTMAMAFAYFAKEKVDIAVIEVGLGGRLDSTNIINPEISVITNIGYDHTEFLGDTLSKIASEKAGIIKPHIPIVIGETQIETAPVFIQIAQQNNAPIIFADRNTTEADTIPCQLHGTYQKKNKITALATLLQLQKQGWKITDKDINNGFAEVCSTTGLRGRWEILNEYPLTICDTGHNSHGIRYVAQSLEKLALQQTVHIVFGMVNDKDIEEVLKLLPKRAIYYFTQAQTKRAIAADKLYHMAKKCGLRGKNYCNVVAAYEAARNNARKDDVIFIGGSNYIVGEALINCRL